MCVDHIMFFEYVHMYYNYYSIYVLCVWSVYVDHDIVEAHCYGIHTYIRTYVHRYGR